MRLILIVAFVAVFGQQPKPDFNGYWLVNREKSAKAIKDGRVTHDRIVMTLSEKEWTWGDDPSRIVCGFGPKPTESQSSIPGRTTVCSSKWDGDELVATMTRKPDPRMKGYPTETKVRLRLVGTELTMTNVTQKETGETIKYTIVFDRER